MHAGVGDVNNQGLQELLELLIAKNCGVQITRIEPEENVKDSEDKKLEPEEPVDTSPAGMKKPDQHGKNVLGG